MFVGWILDKQLSQKLSRMLRNTQLLTIQPLQPATNYELIALSFFFFFVYYNVLASVLLKRNKKKYMCSYFVPTVLFIHYNFIPSLDTFYSIKNKKWEKRNGKFFSFTFSLKKKCKGRGIKMWCINNPCYSLWFLVLKLSSLVIFCHVRSSHLCCDEKIFLYIKKLDIKWALRLFSYYQVKRNKN